MSFETRNVVRLEDGRQVLVPDVVERRVQEVALDVVKNGANLYLIEEAIRLFWAEGVLNWEPPKPPP